MERPAGYSSLRRLGDFKPSARRSDHDGWILCDGRTILRSQYPRFFEATEVPGQSLTIPDGKDALLIGAGGRLKLLQRGGSNEFTLTVDQLPPHAHGYEDATPEATASKTGLLGGVLNILTGVSGKAVERTTKAAGAGKPVKVEPVAIGVNHFIYVGAPS